MSASLASQAQQKIIAGFTQAHVDYVINTRDIILQQWGNPSFLGSVPVPPTCQGPTTKVIRDYAKQAGFVGSSAGVYSSPINALLGQYNQGTSNLEILVAWPDWDRCHQPAVNAPPLSPGLRQHLGQLLFHELIHSLDPRPKPSSVAAGGWLAYYQNPLEVTAHAGSIAWEMRVRGVKSVHYSPVARRIIRRLSSVPGRRQVYSNILAEIATWNALLNSMNVPP